LFLGQVRGKFCVVPYALLRHVPLHNHLGEAWIEKVRQVDDQLALQHELSSRPLRGYPVEQVNVEQLYPKIANKHIADEILGIANSQRTLHDVLHLVMIRAQVVWRTKGGVVQRGGESLATRFIKADRTDELDIDHTEIAGAVIRAPTKRLSEAVEHYEDEEDWTILHLITDPDLSLDIMTDETIKTAAHDLAWSFTDGLVEGIQAEVNQGVGFEDAIRRLRVMDSTSFVRSMLR
jgi:hypothetical protein